MDNELNFVAMLQDMMSDVNTRIAESFTGVATSASNAGDTISQAMSGASESIAPLDESLTGLGASADDAATQVDVLTNALEANVSAQTNAATASEANATSQGDDATATDAATVSTDASTASVDANTVSKQANNDANDASAGGAEKFGSALGLVGLAAAAAGAAVVYMGSQSQDSLSKIASLTGASKQQMQEYTTGLEQMSEEIGVSMTDAANGLYYVVSAGFTGSDAMNVLKIAMEGAKAGGADMQTVADALTSSLNAYGASASDAGNYSDIMIQAVTQGKQTFADFASAVGMAAVTGHTAGFSFDQVAAAEATMTQSGLNAHRSVMQLDFLMRAIGLSADVVAGKAKKLGIEGFDTAAFSSDTLIQKLEYLQQVSGGNKAAFETLVGGANGLSAAELLLGKNGDTYNGILDKMKHSSGSTAAAFATSESTMSAHAGHLAGSFTVLAYNVAQVVTPAVNSVFGAFAGIFTSFAGYVASHGQATTAILAGLAIVIGGILVASLQIMTASLWEAATAEGVFALPILGIAAAIGAVVAVVILAYQHIGWFHNAVNAATSALSRFWNNGQVVVTAFHAIQAAIAPVISFAESLWHALVSAGSAILGAIEPLIGLFGHLASSGLTMHVLFMLLVAAFHSAVAAAAPLIATIRDQLGGVFKQLQSTLQDSLIPAWHSLQAALVPLMRSFQIIGEQIMGLLLPIWRQLVAQFHVVEPILKGVALAAGVILVVALGLLIGILKGVIMALAAVIKGVIEFVGGFIQLISGLVTIIVSLWTGFFNIVNDIAHGQWGKLKTDSLAMLNGLWQGLQQIVLGIWHMIHGAWQIGVGSIQAFTQGFVSGIIGFFTHLAETLVGHSIVPDMINAIVQFFSQLPGKAMAFIVHLHDQAIAKVQDLANQAVGLGSSIVQGLINGIKSMISAGVGALGDLGNQMLQHFKSIFGIHSPSTVFHGLGANMSQGLLDGVRSIDVGGAVRDHYAKAITTELSGLGKTAGQALGAAGANGALALTGAGTSASGAPQSLHVSVDFGNSAFAAGTKLVDPRFLDQLVDQVSDAIATRLGIQNPQRYGYTGRK